MPGILPMKMIRVGSSTQNRVAQACDRCRSKKIRCDGIRPCCTQCANVGFECKTSDKLSRRAFPRGYTESLEDRVRVLEAECRELKQLLDEKDEKIDMLSRLHSFSPASRKDSSSLSPSNAAQVKAEIETPREDVLYVEIPAPVEHGAPSTGTSTTSAFIESFEQKIQEHEKRPANISSATLMEEVHAVKPNSNNASRTPPRILSDQYINLFFQEWQPMLPVLHRPTFLRVYEQYLAGPDAGNWQSNKQAIAQLFLIFEISALSSGHQLKTNCPSYENQWRKAMYTSSATPNVASIQCHVLAQLCCLLRGDYAQLSHHRGIAVGMCHQLGMHQGHKYHTIGVFEAETRRKVFWCQFTLDKFASAATGSPMMLRDDDITTDYPADVDDENLSSQGFSPALPGEVTKISSALALFKAAKILSKALEDLYSPKASYQLSISRLHAHSDDLDQWSEELPEHLRLRFHKDKPATNVVSCRSPLLSLMYFFVRSLIHRPLLCHASGSAQAAATIVLATAGKHSLQILDLLDERRMNYTFPFNKKELLLASAFSMLWQSIDLEEDSKLVKDNQKSLQLSLAMLSRESEASHAEFQRIACAFITLPGRRTSAPKHIDMHPSSAKSTNSMPAPSPPNSKTGKSAKRQLQAIASRFSNNLKGSPKADEGRRATISQTGMSQSMSQQHRAGSTVSLSSTRSAPGVISPTPGQLPRSATMASNHSINLDYFPLGDEFNADTQTNTSSSTMLPPRKPTQMSPNIANASWDSLLLTNYDASNAQLFGNAAMGSTAQTPMCITSNDWIQDGNWNLPAMDFSSKAPVPQSLLSFSGESITSGDDFIFSASSNNGSTSTGDALDVSPLDGQGMYKGITIPVDDDIDFEALEG